MSMTNTDCFSADCTSFQWQWLFYANYWQHCDKKMLDNICLKMLGALNIWIAVGKNKCEGLSYTDEHGVCRVWHGAYNMREIESAYGIFSPRMNAACKDLCEKGLLAMQWCLCFDVDFLFYVETLLSLVFLWTEEKGWVGVKTILMEEVQLHVNCLNNLSKCTTCVMGRFVNSTLYMCESSL